MNVIKIFTDGACSGNPGNGGWGVVIINGNEITKHSGSEFETTNNRMELRAAIEGIKSVRGDYSIIVYTDSQYLKNGITTWITGWKNNNWLTSNKKPVKNKDLWELLDQLNNQQEIKWQWVKAHQIVDDEFSRYNNLADKLARDAVENE